MSQLARGRCDASCAPVEGLRFPKSEQRPCARSSLPLSVEEPASGWPQDDSGLCWPSSALVQEHVEAALAGSGVSEQPLLLEQALQFWAVWDFRLVVAGTGEDGPPTADRVGSAGKSKRSLHPLSPPLPVLRPLPAGRADAGVSQMRKRLRSLLDIPQASCEDD